MNRNEISTAAGSGEHAFVVAERGTTINSSIPVVTEPGSNRTEFVKLRTSNPNASFALSVKIQVLRTAASTSS